MRNKIQSFIYMFLGLTAFFATEAQSTDELIKLHHEKLRNLYGSRGMYEKSWPYSGEVSEEDIQEVLGQYRKKVGMLWYVHQNDTLWVTGIRADQAVLQKGVQISADSLTGMVQLINRYFSYRDPSRSPVNRAAEIENEPDADPKERFEKEFPALNSLLFPFPKLLDSLDHLILVPALNLATLPFACFKPDNQSVLIEKMSFSIAPSLFEFMAMDYIRNQEENSYGYYSDDSKYALFVSNPDYPKRTGWHFPDLPGAQKEVSAIADLLDSSGYQCIVLTGKNATQSQVLNEICDYGILYFATHGISNPENPLDGSFLVLSGEGFDTCFLTAREIQEWRHNCKLKAKLVILSACQTGLGKTHDAGIIGLARAFQISGAKDVLMSLWNVDDRETAALMGKFFEIYRRTKAKTPYASMREAMLWYRDTINPDPYYWAAFSVFGIP